MVNFEINSKDFNIQIEKLTNKNINLSEQFKILDEEYYSLKDKNKNERLFKHILNTNILEK